MSELRTPALRRRPSPLTKGLPGRVFMAALLCLTALLAVGCGGPLPWAGVTPAATATAPLQPAATAGPAQTPFQTATPLPTRTLIPSPTASPTATSRPTRTPWPTRLLRSATLPAETPTPAASVRSAPAVAAVGIRPSLTGQLVFQLSSGGLIYGMGADGEGLRPLTHGLDPALSPDGQRVAFARWDGPQRGLWVLDLGAGGEEFVFGHGQLKAPAWTPDGRAVVFTRQEGGKPAREICFPPWGCFTLSADPYWRLGIFDVVDRSFRDLPSDLHSHSPAMDPAGQRVFYAGDSGLQFSALVGDEGGMVREASALSSPALSPDGGHVIYMVYLHDHWDLFVSPIAGAGQTRLTSSSALAPRAPNNVAPAWSPDGRSIAFLTDRDGEWRLYVMRADGSNQRPLLPEQLAGLTFHYDFVNERVVSWGR